MMSSSTSYLIKTGKTNCFVYTLIFLHSKLLSLFLDIIIRCMESNGGKWYDGIHLNVPLRIAMKIGKKWANMEECNAS